MKLDLVPADAPPVSLGLPVYNGERFLPEALDSLLGQNFGDFELIISDNDSADRTREICLDYAQRDPRIRYVRQATNVGAAENYNLVFRLSRGRYFKWAAADDICLPGMIQQCYDVLESDPGAVLSYPKTLIIDENGAVLGPYDDNLHLDQASTEQRFRQLLFGLRECNAVFGLIRRDVLSRTPLIGHYIHSDSCLLAELSLLGRFHEIPQALFLRRDHPKASSADRSIDSQMAFFDPALRQRIVLPFWRRRWENLKSVWHVPLPLGTRLTLSGAVSRCVMKRWPVHQGEFGRAVRQLAWRAKVRIGSMRANATQQDGKGEGQCEDRDAGGRMGKTTREGD